MEHLLFRLIGALVGSYATRFFTSKKAIVEAIFNYKEMARDNKSRLRGHFVSIP